MNHVFVVKRDKIEKIELAENLAQLVSLVSKPVNSDVLSRIVKHRDDNLDNQSVRKYYFSMLGLGTIEEEYADGSAFYKYYNINNVLGEWFGKIRHTLMIVANECGETEIANYIKPSSKISVRGELMSVYNRESLELNTLNIINIPGSEDKAKLIVKGDGIEYHVDVNDGDIILLPDEETEINTTIKVEGHGEILSIYPEPMFNLNETRDKRIEDYLNGITTTKNHVNNLILSIADVIKISFI
jgi:hypothetical protein